jgi:uncharacterized SAM-binding protein YcdF (DUF218 family)
MTAKPDRAAMSTPYPQGGRVRSRSRKTITALSLILVAPLAIYLNRAAVLRTAADLWIVSDQEEPADAVVILGGGTETRPFAAADDYRRGLAKKVLLANARITRPELLGIVPSTIALTRTALVKLGVPEGDIEIFGTELANTHDEALALREWLIRSHAGTVIIPTEIFSSRRVRWVMQRALNGTGAKVEIRALERPDYSRADWWRNERGIVDFQNEVLKYIYYRFKY